MAIKSIGDPATPEARSYLADQRTALEALPKNQNNLILARVFRLFP